MSKRIDLSFLKHTELPKKEFTIAVNGKEQTFNIKPVNGRGLTSLGLIGEDDVDRSSKMCLLALMYGLGITQEQAELYMENDIFSADAVAAEVLSFTQEYQNEILNARKDVKKNTKTKNIQSTQNI